MAETHVTGFKQIFADKKLQKAYEKTCFMNKDYEINTAAEREKLNSLFGENGKYRASMTDDQITMMDSFIGTTTKKQTQNTEKEGCVTVYNNGANSSATIIDGDNNTVVNGNVINNNGQIAIGHDNEQNMGTRQETSQPPVKSEQVKTKAPVKKKDKPVERRDNDVVATDRLSTERPPLTDATDLTEERARNSKRDKIYINQMPATDKERDLADFKKQVCAKLPKDLTWYDDMIKVISGYGSKEGIIEYLAGFGLKLELVY